MTFTVRGIKVRSASRCRFIVVAVRPAPVETREVFVRGGRQIDEKRVWAAFAEVIRRSDSIATARAAARKWGHHRGAFAVVVDTVTGEEV